MDFEVWVYFQSASKDVLGDKALKSMADFQKGLASDESFQSLCLLNRDDECATLGGSLVNIGAFLASASDDTSIAASPTDDVAEAAAKCMNVDETTFLQAVDYGCFNWTAYDVWYPGFGIPFPCSVEASYSIAPRAELDPLLRAVCTNGSATVESSCGAYSDGPSLLKHTRQMLVGKEFNCDSLQAEYTRLMLPDGRPYEGYGCWDDQWEARFYAAKDMIPALFDLKKEVEESNEDITVYFTFPYGGPMFDYYLDKDLLLLMLSFVLVFSVLVIQTDSFFISACGMFEIIISFPLGMFVWILVLQEPGVTYLMYNGNVNDMYFAPLSA